jgi:hypothetical protein
MKYTVEVENSGTIRWYKEGTIEYHREGGPAIEWTNGTKEWYLNDKLHREDGPAIEYADGTKYWYLNGKQVDEPKPSCEGKEVEIDGVRYKLTMVK